MCSLRDAAKDLEAAGAVVVGLSRDDVATQARFVKEQELVFPLFSDPDGSAVARLDAAMDGRPLAARVTFVIDPDGVLRHVDRQVSVKTHGADLLRRLEGLKTR